MILVLRVHGNPLRQIYRDARARPYLDLGEAHHALLVEVDALQASASVEDLEEIPNLVVRLDNRHGQVRDLWSEPPEGAAAELVGPDGIVFAGVVGGLALGPIAELEILA